MFAGGATGKASSFPPGTLNNTEKTKNDEKTQINELNN